MPEASATRAFAISPRDVVLIDDWLERLGGAWDLEPRTLFRIRLCIAELAANTVQHGVPRSGDDEMIVTVRRVSDGIAVEFCDTCAPFDPTILPRRPHPESIASVEPSGRGLVLLHAYARNLAYTHDGTYNRVTLTIPSA